MSDQQKHTPGPWEANDIPTAPEKAYHFATAVWAGGFDENDRRVLICSVAPESFQAWQPNKFEQTANARLIAASPALLAACKAAREAIQYPSGKTAEQRNEVLEQLAEAIKSAEGGEG